LTVRKSFLSQSWDQDESSKQNGRNSDPANFKMALAAEEHGSKNVLGVPVPFASLHRVSI